MRDARYQAMMRAVDMARTGQFRNWWAIAARMRIERYGEDALDWTDTQKRWLDQLCAEARSDANGVDRNGPRDPAV